MLVDAKFECFNSLVSIYMLSTVVVQAHFIPTLIYSILKRRQNQLQI